MKKTRIAIINGLTLSTATCIMLVADSNDTSTRNDESIYGIHPAPAHEELFFSQPTNKPKWFQGYETSKIRVPGKKKFNKYNSRKKSRNNKHK